MDLPNQMIAEVSALVYYDSNKEDTATLLRLDR